jgi:hypothetical protein
VGCCAAEEQCLSGTCQTPLLCLPQAQHCSAGGQACCNGLACVYMNASNLIVDCVAGEATCTCDLPPQACLPLADPCTATGTGCCGPGFCQLDSSTVGAACDDSGPCHCVSGG